MDARAAADASSGAAASAAAARASLVRLMQLAHAGERAAAHAYNGHWRAVSDPGERAEIRRIEEEEWEHRALVRGILRDLGAAPRPLREALMGTLGRVIGWSCFVGGWFIPMYGAGKLEAQNVNEYTTAAQLAAAAGEQRHIPALRAMAVVEERHEQWFREKCAGHWLARWIPLWQRPPPLPAVQETAVQDTAGQEAAAQETAAAGT